MRNRITVCAACLRASCWHGEFYCEAYQTAGTIDKTIEELTALRREHPEYWEIDPNTGCAYRCNPMKYRLLKRAGIARQGEATVSTRIHPT